MTHIQGVAPQPMVGGAHNQPVAGSGQPQAAPEGLGRSHSVGMTILRVVACFFTVGISELVMGMIRKAKSASAPALPHLPQNGANDIRNANARMARQLDGGDAALKEIVNRGKAKATSTLGMATKLDRGPFALSLKIAIKECKTALNEEGLEALAEKVARDQMTTTIVKTLVRRDPNYAGQTDEQEKTLINKLLGTPQMKAVHDAVSREALESLLTTAKDMVQEHSASQAMKKACTQELFTAGMQKFCETTGLAPGSFTLNTGPLKDKLDMIASDLNQNAATAERPYAKAGKEAIMAEWKPRAERFFTERAQAYNSIATLNVPDALKKGWQHYCMTTTDSIEHDTFTKVADMAAKAMKAMSTATATLTDLLNPDTPIEEKAKILEEYSLALGKALEESYATERRLALGADGRHALLGMGYEAIFANSPEVMEGLRGQPELLAALEDAVETKYGEAMLMAKLSADYVARVGGGLEMFHNILVNTRDAAQLVITNRGKAKATSVLGKAAELNEDTFKTVLKKAAHESEISLNGMKKLDEDKLEALAEKVARDALTESIAKDLIDKNPNYAGLTDEKKDLLASELKRSPEMKAVHDAASPEAMAPLLATVKDMVQMQSAALAMHNTCKQELFAAGMQTFCNMTGLAPGSFDMNTWPLEDKFGMIASDLDQNAATAESPHARAGRDTIMAAWQPRAERFFTERAKAYTSIASLNISDALKKDWQQRCLTTKESISADTFTKSVAAAQKVLSTDTLTGLLNPDTSLDGKVKIFEDVAASLDKAMIEIFGQERVSKMGPDELGVLTGLACEIIFANSPEFFEGLHDQPGLLKEFDELDEIIGDKVTHAMDIVHEMPRRELDKIIKGQELSTLLFEKVESQQEYAL